MPILHISLSTDSNKHSLLGALHERMIRATFRGWARIPQVFSVRTENLRDGGLGVLSKRMRKEPALQSQSLSVTSAEVAGTRETASSEQTYFLPLLGFFQRALPNTTLGAPTPHLTSPQYRASMNAAVHRTNNQGSRDPWRSERFKDV